MNNKIEWKRIYYNEEVSNTYKGHADETWETDIEGGKLIRHVHYELNEGDESNRVETMVFLPVK